MRPLFATGPSINTRLLVALLLSLSLLALGDRHPLLQQLRTLLSILVLPIQLLVSVPFDVTQELVSTVKTYDQLLEENKKLRQEQLVYKTRLLKFEALEKENIRLRALLENSYKLGEQVLVAEILSVNFAPYQHVVLVNKGQRFGVHVQQPVLDVNGVMGQVVRVTPFAAEIMLITDPSHAIPVQVNRNGLRTIAFGIGQPNRLSLPFLPNNADIQPGDLLITSGIGGVFPQGYPVGVVDEFTPQPDKPFAKVLATPKAQLESSREVLLVWSHSDPLPLEGSHGAASAQTSDAAP